MIENSRHLILLGPQPQYQSLSYVLNQIQPQAPVAVITAGWEAEENQDHELRVALGGQDINLNLFHRTEQLFAEDPELIQTLQARQDELRHLRDAYNDRLNLLLKAARHIIRRDESLIAFDAEQESAIAMVRQLDQQYFVRTSQIHDRYEERLSVSHRPTVLRHRHEIAEILHKVSMLLIAGGHVAIILNRLQIFGILEMRPDLPIIAWSGGTMALADQIVFFHDSPPQGPGDAEVLRAGMGLLDDILPLPDGKYRLNLDDQARVELFARRFDRYRCTLFDEQTILERKHNGWQSIGPNTALQLMANGFVTEFQS